MLLFIREIDDFYRFDKLKIMLCKAKIQLMICTVGLICVVCEQNGNSVQDLCTPTTWIRLYVYKNLPFEMYTIPYVNIDTLNFYCLNGARMLANSLNKMKYRTEYTELNNNTRTNAYCPFYNQLYVTRTKLCISKITFMENCLQINKRLHNVQQAHGI